jgi:hypothetical protein
MPQGALQVYGTEKLARLGHDLRVIGGPTARGLRSHLRVGVKAAAIPLRNDVKRAALAIPARGPKTTGLRRTLAKATKLKVLASSRSAAVRIYVDPVTLKAAGYPPSMATNVEGNGKRWRHPVYARADESRDEWTWVAQHPTPFFFPTIRPKIAAVRAACVAAIVKTTAQLPKEL